MPKNRKAKRKRRSKDKGWNIEATVRFGVNCTIPAPTEAQALKRLRWLLEQLSVPWEDVTFPNTRTKHKALWIELPSDLNVGGVYIDEESE
jgi:hypothetical protein